MRRDKALTDLEKISFEDLKKTPLNKMRIFHPAPHIIYALEQVKKELIDNNLNIKPTIWVSDEWFCPDGTAGIGVPFYLSSSRLTKIEKKEVGFVEGQNLVTAKKLIRHELGHVIDNLFQLRRNKMRQVLFGKSSVRYPTSYFYKPFSKNFVRHISEGYAQCHPTEDFAETFAVWLDPNSNWKKKYQSWGCYKKLLFIDSLMEEIRGKKPKTLDKNEYYHLNDMDKTYGKYLSDRKRKFNKDDHFWNDLKGEMLATRHRRSATILTKFLKDYSPEIIENVSKETGHPKYLVKNIIKDVKRSASGAKLGSSVLSSKEIMSYHITKKANDFINEGRHLTRL